MNGQMGLGMNDGWMSECTYVCINALDNYRCAAFPRMSSAVIIFPQLTLSVKCASHSKAKHAAAGVSFLFSNAMRKTLVKRGGSVRTISFQVCNEIPWNYPGYMIMFNPHSNLTKQVFLLPPNCKHLMKWNHLLGKLQSEDLNWDCTNLEAGALASYTEPRDISV